MNKSCQKCGSGGFRHNCSCKCSSCGRHKRDLIHDIKYKWNIDCHHNVIHFDDHCDHRSCKNCGKNCKCGGHNCKCHNNQHHFDCHHQHHDTCSKYNKQNHCKCHNHHDDHCSICRNPFDDHFKIRLGGLTTGLEFRLRQLTGCFVNLHVGDEGSNNQINGRIYLVGSNFVEIDMFFKKMGQDEPEEMSDLQENNNRKGTRTKSRRKRIRKNKKKNQDISMIIPMNRIDSVTLINEDVHL